MQKRKKYLSMALVQSEHALNAMKLNFPPYLNITANAPRKQSKSRASSHVPSLPPGTKLIVVIVVAGATLGFGLAAAFWTAAVGDHSGATRLKGAGGSYFVAAMFVTLDLPWGLSSLPVVDPSNAIIGAGQKRA
ncbi:hypothetical protein LZ554_009337 [Drepanopeziza brunnea f. sp. 'monogermtubi']|nr:hypothetical protein LZ554_009337 [Drepanopeziza brunnea f. sp. 'monogermtubi']